MVSQGETKVSTDETKVSDFGTVVSAALNCGFCGSKLKFQRLDTTVSEARNRSSHYLIPFCVRIAWCELRCLML